MKTIAAFWKAESAVIVAIVIALAGVVTLPGPWEKVLGALLPLLGGAAVRSTVFAPDTVQGLVAAAATAVASQLAPETAGKAGTIPTTAQAVVDGVVEGALKL